MQDVKNEVYELLWELFKDDCPYFEGMVESEPYRDGRDDCFKSMMPSSQIWTILSEILPDIIIIDGESFNRKQNANIFDGKRDFMLFYSEKKMLKTYWHSNIWEAILNLLEQVRDHKDRDKFEMRWGK